MRRKFKKRSWIAIMLCLALLLGVFPINVIALDSVFDIGAASNNSASDVIADSQEYIDDTVIGEVVEITSLREENVKHFCLADGTYEAVVYANPVHRQDENGIWQDIDNNLSLTSDGTSQKYSTSDSRVKFADTFKMNSELFVLSENGYSISMSLVGEETTSKLLSSDEKEIVSAMNPIISNSAKSSDAKTFTSLNEATKINNRSSIIYNSVKNNTALEYILQGNDIKENIIVNAPCENYEYEFQMNLVGLQAELDNRGNIKLYDSKSGQSKYVIPAPYMYDNNGEYSTMVTYALSLIKEGVYLLNISADEAWINSPSRSFPVTIDPSITVDSVFWDSYTNAASPNYNYGYDEELWVSNNKTSYICMSLPELPSGATFNHAYLYVSYYYHITTGGLVAGAYQVLEYWDEGSITYNNAPAVSTTPLDTYVLSASTNITEASPGLAIFDITDAASDWYDDDDSNFGIAIKRESSTVHTNASVILKSFETYDDDSPYIGFNYIYTVPDGVYALQNHSSMSSWMSVEDDSVWAGNHIQQAFSNSSPASIFDRSSLFKISRINGTSRYVIRSMLNNNLSFGVSGTEIITKEIPSADSDVASADTFYIEWDGYGFLIRPYGSAHVIGIASTSTANLTIVHETQVSSYERWSLVRYTGSNRSGETFYRPISWTSVGHIVGNTDTAVLVGWSTYINANTLSMDIEPGYEALGTLVWDASANQITLSALAPGQIKLNARIKYANGTQVHTASFEYMIVPQEGNYYIQNVSTAKYIDIEGPSTNEGAVIQQWQYHTGNQAKWNIEHVSNSGGYVRLKSVYSNLYIGVDSSNTSSIKQYNTQNDYTLWKIERSSRGNLIFVCKATESTNWVLTAPLPLSFNSNGTNLTQVTYMDDSNYRDEWRLRPIKYSLAVNHYLDNGYEIRFNSTGQDIAEYQEICSQILFELFGVESTYVISTYCSCADICTGTPVTIADTTTACTHSNIGHKTRWNLMNNIVSSFGFGDNTTTKIVWTGHVLESRSSGSYDTEHVVIMTIGMVTDWFDSNSPPDVIRYQRIYTLLHEISHQLGAPDHYCYDENSFDCNNPTNDCWRCDNGLPSKPVCIMTDRTYDIEARLLAGNVDSLYCNQCKSSTHDKGIQKHLEDHHK